MSKLEDLLEKAGLPWMVKYGRNGFGTRGKDSVTEIGPITPDHNHWDGACLSASDDQAELTMLAVNNIGPCVKALRAIRLAVTNWPVYNWTDGPQLAEEIIAEYGAALDQRDEQIREVLELAEKALAALEEK